jgi:leucyl-tRNA synthetase
MATPRQIELKYSPTQLEKKWQSRWDETRLYHVSDDDSRTKWYELTMYPYPSGDLHIGHWFAMAPADAHARFRRMQGYNVLHPMGFDAFGLPAENAAIQRGIHPYTWTMNNIENMRRQLRSMGAIYDWDREIICALPEYYKWNQWLFLKFYKEGLAYRGLASVNWCDDCQTVLANEQVVNGSCERSDTPVYKRDLEQWFLRITDYADELLQMDSIDWPEKIKIMQRNWIGRSNGIEVSFDIEALELGVKELRTFTTRIDTIHGVTFVVLAPEHPLVPHLTTAAQKVEVDAYILNTRRHTEVERLSTDLEKTGVFLGSYCINRLNGQEIPIFIADYALLTYGTGVVMGVPAHDQRDYDFAKRYDLPIRVVVSPHAWHGEDLDEAWIEPGIMTNSNEFDGLSSEDAKNDIADLIEEKDWGQRAVSYRMRDWLVSRQRYWGTPIPVIHCDTCGIVPVPERDLPVLLPEDAEFLPTGESPLKLHQGFLNTNCPECGSLAKRETDTLDTFFDSSWYFLRYTSPSYQEGPFHKEIADRWSPVDQYTGGAEHAVMHLLYARFFSKALRDLGLVSFDEPFLRLYNQGTIIANGSKMSKSRGNVVSPDIYVQELGADVVRTYLMFLGPWDQGGDWSDSGINGMARWLNRVWDLAQRNVTELDLDCTDQSAERTLTRVLHKTVKLAIRDMERFKFNTSLAFLMDLTNHMAKSWEQGDVGQRVWAEAIEKLTLLLAPIAPHLAEEIWERTGHPYSVHDQPLPTWDESLVVDEVVTLVVQVNGKVRDRIQVSADIVEEEAKRLALASDRVQGFIESKELNNLIYVPGRLVNIVTA